MKTFIQFIAESRRHDWHGDAPPDHFAGYEPGGHLSHPQHIHIHQIEPTEGHNEEHVKRLMHQFRKDPSGIPAPTVEFSHDHHGIDFVSTTDGHHRIEAARRLGYKRIPVRVWVHPDDWPHVKKHGGLEIRTAPTHKILQAKKDLSSQAA